MKQLAITDAEYNLRKRTTKREKFLVAMNDMIPWTVGRYH